MSAETIAADHSSPVSKAILRAADLSFRVEGRELWHQLRIDLCAGDRLAIVGPSGSGKTVLLRSLAGLEQPPSGTIHLHDRLIDAWRMPEYRSRVTYVPQRPALREGVVEDALRAPFRFRVRPNQHYSRSRANELLATVGRDDSFLKQTIDRLSGGESQIVALVRALLIEPEVLLLDESTASLDGEAEAAAETLVDHWLNENDQRAAVWTSHDEAQLQRVARRRISLRGAAK